MLSYRIRMIHRAKQIKIGWKNWAKSRSVHSLALALAVRGSLGSLAESSGVPLTRNYTLLIEKFHSPRSFGNFLQPSAPSRSIWRAARWLFRRFVGHNLNRTSHPRREPPSLPALHHRPSEAGAFTARAPCAHSAPGRDHCCCPQALTAGLVLTCCCCF